MNICWEIWVYGICVWFFIELVKFRMEKHRCLYNSMGLYSFGYEKYRYMVWNPFFVYGLGLETPKLISC